MKLQTAPSPHSIDNIIHAAQEAAKASQDLMKHAFRTEDVTGTDAAVQNQMTQKVIDTQYEDLEANDRLKLYGLIIARAIVTQSEQADNIADFSFFVNLGSTDQENDCCPATIWIRNPNQEKSQYKAADCSRKALLSVESLLSMLQGDGIQQQKINPRRWTDVSELDDFFSTALDIKAEETVSTPKKRRSSKIRDVDLFAFIKNAPEAQSALDELSQIFPEKIAKTLSYCQWSIRLNDAYKINETNTDYSVDCRRVNQLLTKLRNAARAADDEETRTTLSRTVELIEKLSAFVRENAADKIFKG